jgi:hypothetical protein
MSRRAILSHGAFCLATLGALSLKRWNVEAVYSDDPTVRLLLKWAPSWTSHIKANDREQDAIASRALLTDENAIVGEGMHHFAVGWGWFMFLPAWAGVAMVSPIPRLFPVRAPTAGLSRCCRCSRPPSWACRLPRPRPPPLGRSRTG